MAASDFGPTQYGKHGNCATLSYTRQHQHLLYGYPAIAEGQAGDLTLVDYVDGCAHSDGWVPMPNPSGYGWIWAGAKPADYNRFIRQSINDTSTIQGAVGAWSFLNGSPKWLALVHGEDPVGYTLLHPGIICIVPGWYSGGQWDKSRGGDGSDQKFAVFFRDGGAVAQSPEPSHGTKTGFLVVGALAAAGAAVFAGGAILGGTSVDAAVGGVDATTVAASTATETVAGTTDAVAASAAVSGAAASAPSLSISGLLGSIPSSIVGGGGTLGGTAAAIAGGAAKLLGGGGGGSMDDTTTSGSGDGFSFGSLGDLLGGLSNDVKQALGLYGQVEGAVDGPSGGGSGKAVASSGAAAQPQAGASSTLVLVGIAALVFLL